MTGNTRQDPAASTTLTSLARISTIKVWISAFIPRELGKQTSIVSSGPHQGETMLGAPAPRLPCYLTDNRDFCPDAAAKSRMHSAIVINVVEQRITYQQHRCDPTIELNCETGEVTCEESADTSQMKFSDLRRWPGDDVFEVDLIGASKNACLKVANVRLSPNLDYQGTLRIELRDEGRKALVWFRGKIEIYPSFEMYAAANNQPPKALFQVNATLSSSPLDLIGPPARDIYGEVDLVG